MASDGYGSARLFREIPVTDKDPGDAISDRYLARQIPCAAMDLSRGNRWQSMARHKKKGPKPLVISRPSGSNP